MIESDVRGFSSAVVYRPAACSGAKAVLVLCCRMYECIPIYVTPHKSIVVRLIFFIFAAAAAACVLCCAGFDWREFEVVQPFEGQRWVTDASK